MPARAFRARLSGGLAVLIALVLGLLQAGTPCAHALLHLAAAQAQVHQTHPSSQRAVSAALPGDRACPLCAAQVAPALPGPRPAIAALPATAACAAEPAEQKRSAAPLEVFCRPPPVV